MDELEIKYRTSGKALPPQPIRIQVPGWGGSAERKMENNSEPQPWHCRPFTDGATSGLELLYPFETECQIVNESGVARIDWPYRNEPGQAPQGNEFGLFDTSPHQYYLFQSGIDLQAPRDYVLQTQPHPRFFTDLTGTAPVALIGQLETEWWPRTFIVFKVPPPGQRHIFRKGEPYVQIIFLPQKMTYRPVRMAPEEESRRRDLQRDIANSTNYVATNVWHNPEGGQFNNHYKVLARIFARDGVEGVEKAVAEGLAQRRQAFPQGKTLPQLFELADDFLRQGKQIEAMDIYTAIRRADPSNAEAFSRMAMVVSSVGLAAFAIKLMTQAVDRAPRSPLYRAQLGELLLGAQRFGEAEAALRSSLALRPDDAKVQNDLKMALERQQTLQPPNAGVHPVG